MSHRWGILATGRIAHALAEAIVGTPGHTLTAVGSRSEASARHFADTYGADVAAHGSYQQLIDDDGVDVIYVATPHPQHAQWVLKALRAGKHVLCEKPIGVNYAEAMAMVHAATQNKRFLMEAFMYRCHPQITEIQNAIRDNRIGEVRHIHASFGYDTPVDADSRLFANRLGGGGILDVGCYPVSLARLLLGEPLTVQATGHLGDTGVDHWADALLGFDNDASAHVATSITLDRDNVATIYGSRGKIHVPMPWQPGRDTDGSWSFVITSNGASEEITGQAPPLYQLEVEAVGRALDAGHIEAPEMTHADTLGNALVLDRWREEIGLTYEQEQPQAHGGPLLGTIHRSANPTISSGTIPGLAKPVSRLVIGCDNQPNLSHASVMWDHFFEQGGNAFDTAYIYGGGDMERYLGHWQAKRNVREDIVLIGKGAHTPHNHPEFIAPQLEESLSRLQTDYVDVYFLHRDNPQIPVSEFVDALNEQVAAGKIRIFGGSNWTLERTRAFNDYARANGLQGFSAISNNFSLARMVEPIWPGVESVDDNFLSYLQTEQLALMPWSSQARGFFTPWAEAAIAQHGSEQTVITRMQPTLAELSRTWFSPENFERRKRAGQLAERHQTTMINVALAYVLGQSFPTFPLVGPRQLDEIDSCAQALQLGLSQEEIDALAAPLA